MFLCFFEGPCLDLVVEKNEPFYCKKTGRRETALSRGAPWDHQVELGEDFDFKRPQKVIFGEITFDMFFTRDS